MLTGRPSSLLVLLLITALPTDVCGADPLDDVSDTGAFLDWLHLQPGLGVGRQVPRSFSHVDVTQVEITTVQREAACSFGDPPYVVVQPFGGLECCTGYSLTADHVLRAYVMGISDAVIVAIVDAPTQGEFDILLPMADAVLDTLEFPAS